MMAVKRFITLGPGGHLSDAQGQLSSLLQQQVIDGSKKFYKIVTMMMAPLSVVLDSWGKQVER